MKCNDCIHDGEYCRHVLKQIKTYNEEINNILHNIQNRDDVEKFCGFFLNREDYVKLPCKPGDTTDVVMCNPTAHWIPVKEEGFWLDDAATWSATGKPTTKIQYKCSNCGKIQGTIVVDNDYKCCPYCTAIIEK